MFTLALDTPPYHGPYQNSEAFDPATVLDVIMELAEFNELGRHFRRLRDENESLLRVQELERAAMARVIRANETLTETTAYSCNIIETDLRWIPWSTFLQNIPTLSPRHLIGSNVFEMSWLMFQLGKTCL